MLRREASPFEARGVPATDRQVEAVVRWQARIASDPHPGLDAALGLPCHIAAGLGCPWGWPCCSGHDRGRGQGRSGSGRSRGRARTGARGRARAGTRTGARGRGRARTGARGRARAGIGPGSGVEAAGSGFGFGVGAASGWPGTAWRSRARSRGAGARAAHEGFGILGLGIAARSVIGVAARLGLSGGGRIGTGATVGLAVRLALTPTRGLGLDGQTVGLRTRPDQRGRPRRWVRGPRRSA